MAHPQSNEIEGQLLSAVERLKATPTSGEDMVESYIAAGMPVDVATSIAGKVTDAQGDVDPNLFYECIQERIRIGDKLHKLAQDKAKQAKGEK